MRFCVEEESVQDADCDIIARMLWGSGREGGFDLGEEGRGYGWGEGTDGVEIFF